MSVLGWFIPYWFKDALLRMVHPHPDGVFRFSFQSIQANQSGVQGLSESL